MYLFVRPLKSNLTRRILADSEARKQLLNAIHENISSMTVTYKGKEYEFIPMR